MNSQAHLFNMVNKCANAPVSPSAPPTEAREREKFVLKTSLFCWKSLIFDVIFSSGSILGKSKISHFSSKFWSFFVTHFLSGSSLPVVQLSSYWASSKLWHSCQSTSGDALICKVFLSKVYSQRVKVTHQRGEAQNQPKASLEVKMKMSCAFTKTIWMFS